LPRYHKASRNVLKKFIPLLDRVLVKRAAAEVKSAGGILLPESAQAKVNQVGFILFVLLSYSHFFLLVVVPWCFVI